MKIKYPILDLSPKNDLIFGHLDDRFLIRSDRESIRDEVFEKLVFIDSNGKEYLSKGIEKKGWSGIYGFDRYSFQSLKRHIKIEILFDKSHNKIYSLDELKDVVVSKLEKTPTKEKAAYESIEYLIGMVRTSKSIKELIECFV